MRDAEVVSVGEGIVDGTDLHQVVTGQAGTHRFQQDRAAMWIANGAMCHPPTYQAARGALRGGRPLTLWVCQRAGCAGRNPSVEGPGCQIASDKLATPALRVYRQLVATKARPCDSQDHAVERSQHQ
jgi:hypothetical protein